MANRFWVGGTGSWSDNTNHWSATSGGTGGASVPTSADNVYFDANSFSTAGQTVTVNVTANCLDMDWTGSTNLPTLAGASHFTVYGSLNLSGLGNFAHSGALVFGSIVVGKTVTTAGKTITSSPISFSGVGGEWTLQDELTATGKDIRILAGTLNTNNKAISCNSFTGSNSTFVRCANLGTSVIIAAGYIGSSATDGNFTFNTGTSTFILTGDSRSILGSFIYNNVEFQGTPTTITGSNTFNDIKISAGKTVKFTAGTTQTITSMSGNGTSGSLITLQSTTAGSTYTISKASGILEVSYYSITDSIATGGASFYAPNSTDGGNNTGWTFAAKPFPHSQAVVVF